METLFKITKPTPPMSLIRILIGVAVVTVLAFGDSHVNADKGANVKQPITETDSCIYYQVKIMEQLRITDSLLTIKYQNHEH